MPDEAHEALRNLWRAREDAVNLRLKVRQQLKAFLLRQDRRYAGKTSSQQQNASPRATGPTIQSRAP